MTKISFSHVNSPKAALPDEFYFCNADKCIRHLIVTEQYEIDEFSKCLKPNNCSDCDKYLNGLMLKSFF